MSALRRACVLLGLCVAQGCAFDVTLATRRDDAGPRDDNARDERDDNARDERDEGRTEERDAGAPDALPSARTLSVSLRASAEQRDEPAPRGFETRAVFELTPEPAEPDAVSFTLVSDGVPTLAQRSDRTYSAVVNRYSARWVVELRVRGEPTREVSIEGLAPHTLRLPEPRRPGPTEPFVVRWSPIGADGAAVSVGSQPQRLVSDTGAYTAPPEALRGPSGELREVEVEVRRWVSRTIRDGDLVTAARVELSVSGSVTFE